MRIIAILGLSTCFVGATPSAKFDSADLVVRDGRISFSLHDLLDPDAFYGTVHAVQRRGQDFFIVYGTSEMSRGWPPRGGHCGCCLESYIRWLHVKGGKIIEQQEGRHESCFRNRDGWSIAWSDGKLIWSTEGIEREGDPLTGKIVSIAFTWSFDPARTGSGIVESKSPTKWQPESPKTEQAVDDNTH
jgi:hypothetical protein